MRDEVQKKGAPLRVPFRLPAAAFFVGTERLVVENFGSPVVFEFLADELAPLVKRADEIQAHHPLMAYYCACPLVARRNVFSRRAVSTTPRLSPAPHIRTRARDAPLTRARVSCSLAKCFRPHARG